MAYLVEVPVGVGGGPHEVVKVEIEQSADGLVQVARPGQVVARASRSFGDMVAGIRPVAQHFVDGLRGMAHAPDEIRIEFGLSLSAEADVVISSTTAQANFKVSLAWHKHAPEDSDSHGVAPNPETAP